MVLGLTPPVRGIVCVISGILLLGAGTARGQFSPGELSRAHQQLEGSQNCTQCHEVGREISGGKCLNCHPEIRTRTEGRRGFHGLSAAKKCVDCHKEHLGKNARTTLFDEKSFDHIQTGFLLSGKHAGIGCASCHAAERISDAAVKKLVSEFPHATYLGLSQSCASCHRDPHRGKFTGECSSCHTTISWAAVSQFDHSVTRFPLSGKHKGLGCTKCHAGMESAPSGSTEKFATKPFADCAPCHTSPHASGFSTKECISCHTPEGWQNAFTSSFNHSLTAYRLTGRHAALRCEQCHRKGEGRDYGSVFRIPSGKCTDCHTDKHKGQFVEGYQNNCAACHTLDGYLPSTFTIERHSRTRFPLTGSHMALPCRKCHAAERTASLTFRTRDLRCESCHPDIHRGSFAALMKERSCGACHTTGAWKPTAFDHGTTKFQLTGKHTILSCARCHKEAPRFTGLASSCESCHMDIHMGQFAAQGRTECNECHTPEGWKSLAFDHNTQSAFRLTGAHRNVACSECHHRERSDTTVVVRYKPLSAKCESCHKRRNDGQ